MHSFGGSSLPRYTCMAGRLRPIKLTVPFGQMEARPRMSEAELQTLLRENARRYCAGSSKLPQHALAPDANEIGQPEVL